MRFVSKWSYACAKHLASVTNENHQKRAVYYLGFFIVIGGMVKGAVMLSAALLLGVLVPTVLIVFVFGSLRMVAGGYHMDTYGRCLFVSLGLFILSALIAQYTFTYWSTFWIAALIAFSFAAGLYALIRYAPKDTPNKPITEPQKIRKFKRLSLAYLLIWLVAVSVLAVFRLNLYILAACFGLLLELFAVTPAGHKFFDMIKDSFDKKKARRV